MSNYERLFEFINYFEDKNKIFCSWKEGTLQNESSEEERLAVYDEGLLNFISEIKKTDIMREDAFEFLVERLPVGREVEDAIDDADLETIKAILAYFVEVEDYCEGIWEDAAVDGTFVKILKRFRDQS